MRLNVEISATGRTLDELTESLHTKWCEFVGDYAAVLPNDSEVFVTQLGEDPDTELYKARFIARTKA